MSYFDGVDGRRRSDPLKSLDIAPAQAPDWQLNRVVTAQDGAPEHAVRQNGVNASHYDEIRFAVTPMDADPTSNPAAAPGGTANPTVEVRVWSEQAQSFVPFPTALTKTGLGAGTPYVIDVPAANGSIVGCFVTNDPAGEVVAIAAQGYDKNPHK